LRQHLGLLITTLKANLPNLIGKRAAE